MLFHIAAVAVLTNIAFMELYSFCDLPETLDIRLLSDEKPGIGHHVFGEVYDVDTKMLKKLDELEEHPGFYERSQEDVLWASESKAKSSDNFEEISTLIKVWIYFLPKFRASLLESPMYSSYSNEGSHGLKYCENEESTIRPEDLL